MQSVPYVFSPVTNLDQWGMLSTEFDPVSIPWVFEMLLFIADSLSISKWECSVPRAAASVSTTLGAYERLCQLRLISIKVREPISFQYFFFMPRYIMTTCSFLCITIGGCFRGSLMMIDSTRGDLVSLTFVRKFHDA